MKLATKHYPKSRNSPLRAKRRFLDYQTLKALELNRLFFDGQRYTVNTRVTKPTYWRWP